MNDKGKFNEQVRERTINMAAEVRNLLASVTVSALDRPVVNQLIRSSSSVAANYRSATCARSDAEFLAKICIVLEETDESKFWLEYLVRIKVLNDSEAKSITKELDELVRLFAAIRKKMKEKLGRA